jgi:hypothetical protein
LNGEANIDAYEGTPLREHATSLTLLTELNSPFKTREKLMKPFEMIRDNGKVGRALHDLLKTSQGHLT